MTARKNSWPPLWSTLQKALFTRLYGKRTESGGTMSQVIGVLKIPVVPNPTKRSPGKPVLVLQKFANQLAAKGYIVEAMHVDSCAYLLEHGFTWSQMLDDVTVRAPYLN